MRREILVSPAFEQCVDGSNERSLSKQDYWRLPRPGSIIASSFTSPIDPLYLAAVFDPVFTISYPFTRKVRHATLFEAVYHAFASPQLTPPPGTELVTLQVLMNRNPDRTVVVFPECTTTNGKGVLHPSPSLVSAPPSTKVYPLSLRYSPGDITSPVPATYLEFLWNLLRRPTHCIRVRIAEHIVTPTKRARAAASGPSEDYLRLLKELDDEKQSSDADGDAEADGAADQASVTTQEELDKTLTEEQRMFLREVGKALARLGRVKRVGLGVVEKKGFAELWASQKKGMAKKIS